MDWEAFYNQFRRKDFIPGYEIQRRLGGGAFGDVYKATKQSIGKTYAIKFLKVEEGQEGVVERELAQVGHFAELDHPNLVTIEDMGVVMGVPYLIMGYAGDQTLAKRLKQGPLTEEEASLIFHQIARGVQRLHEKRLVHFDLKPGNIFLQGKRARVGDYGLAKFFDQGNQSLSMGRGTPHYMAPEILHGRADHTADIYSFGVMLYESLLGRKPFHDPDGDGLILRQPHDPLPDVTGVSPGMVHVIHTCLAWEPAERFANLEALMAALPGAPEARFAADDASTEIATLSPEAQRVRQRAGLVRISVFLLLFFGMGFALALVGMLVVRNLIA